jgi:divalent metal cation (Fe/Co/Zn/Cd) transporter
VVFSEDTGLGGDDASSAVEDRHMRRVRDARVALIACACSVAWAALAGIASLTVGAVSGSLALLAFGLSSVIDGSASAVLVWRFRRELGQAGHFSRDLDRVERIAARAVAVAMLASATYVLVQAGRSLIAQAHPEQSGMGIVLLTGSLLLLPPVGIVKLRLGKRLRSRALEGDGVLSIVGATLAATALVGLAANAGLGWWWTDSAAAFLIALFLLREGWRTIKSTHPTQ